MREKKVKCAIIGSTGMVGRVFLKHLSDHPWIEVVIVAASKNSAGQKLRDRLKESDIEGINDKILDMTIQNAADVEDIAKQVDFIFSAVDMSKKDIIKLEEAYAKAEVVVVSNNSAMRFVDDVPMIVPEINGYRHIEILATQRRRLETKYGCIVVKPNCAAQAYMAILDAVMTQIGPNSITDMHVVLMQAISGSGRHLYEVEEIQGNIIALPDEAEKSVKEPQKIFGRIVNKKIVPNKSLRTIASSYRVPVEDGHVANICFKTEHYATTIDDIKHALNTYNPLGELELPSSPYPVINYLGDDKYPSPKNDVENQNGMEFTCGAMKYDTVKGTFQITGLIHNLKRGAAGGAVLTAEFLIALGIIRNQD